MALTLKLGDVLKMINKSVIDFQPYHTQCVLTLESITAKYAAEVIGLEFFFAVIRLKNDGLKSEQN